MPTQPARTGPAPVAAAGRGVMRAVVQDVYGSADRLRLSETESPLSQPVRFLCRCARLAWTGVRVI
jgi:hypothetical protein